MTRTPTKTPTPTKTKLATATPLYYKLKIYFVDRFRLEANTAPYEVFGARYLVSSSNLPEGILKEYFKGPGATEYGWGYSTLYNGFTGFTKLEIIGNVAHVHLKGACAPSGKDFTIADLITLNLKQFSNIQAVKIYDQFDQTQNHRTQKVQSGVF